MATVGPHGESHINTAYFCFSGTLDIYFLSDLETKHCQNILSRPTMAMTVFDTNQPWGSSLQGLQLFGQCYLAKNEEVEQASKLYEARFPAYVEYLTSLSPKERQNFASRFYAFRPTSAKILDEAEFGEEIFITVQVVRDI